MSLPYSAEPLSICCDARRLVEGASDHEQHLNLLQAAADDDVNEAREALARGLRDGDLGEGVSPDALNAVLQRRLVAAASAREARAEARAQLIAACQLLREVENRERRRLDAILVVDDHEDVRLIVAEILRDAGMHVVTASNGLEALLAAYETRPAVIVMDMKMPILDGAEATRLIKASAATRHAKVIAYSGDPGWDRPPFGTLFAAVLHKPAPHEVVLATVRRVASC